MTNEEAIYALKNTAWLGSDKDREATEEAVDMAIEALQQVTGKLNNRDDSLLTADSEACKEQKSKLDLIIRQDAIEAIAKRIYHIEDGNENDALRKAICDIDALPSVNAIPYDSTVTLNSPTIIKATSTDLISRQDALDAFNGNIMVTGRENANEVRSYIKETVDKIMALPSADRPTVDKEYLIDLIQEAVYDGEACAKLMDMVDRPTGKWLKRQTVGDVDFAYCSKCGAPIIHGRTSPLWSYCPNCGAKMGGDNHDAD